jgi:Uma2 family endonuclease
MADKRADYFAAGTLVVWDVDPEAEVIHAYRATDPARPTIFTRGRQADAEPILPGWRVDVDRVFGPIG